MAVKNIINYEGEENVPRDVRRRRHQVMELMRRMGTPVIIKHMYNTDDVDNGIAERSPGYDDIYDQSSHMDHLSHGIGWVSVEKSPNEWISPAGTIVVSGTSPGASYIQAPKYRGFGPGSLTYVVLPDVAEDMFRLDEAGALIRIQTARAQMGWYPNVNDNDLLILTEIDSRQQVVNTYERYQLKQTSPISMRGRDKRGVRHLTEQVDYGNQYVLNQIFELTLVPSNDELYNVEVDR
jgi:hypothetical protein